jgi:hypothetical protein
MSINDEQAQLVREAAAHDAAGVVERAATDLGRVAGKLDDISENTLRRMAAQLRTIARLKRPKLAPQRVPLPGDVRDFG